MRTSELCWQEAVKITYIPILGENMKNQFGNCNGVVIFLLLSLMFLPIYLYFFQMSSPPDSKDDSLTAVCSVCGSPAAAHLHYGAVSCYSCRAFFRRGQPKQIRWISSQNEQINSQTCPSVSDAGLAMASAG